MCIACDSTWVNSFFIARFLNIHRSGVLTALVWLVPHETETAAVSAQVLCTPYNNHAPCHFMQSHIRKEHACLAVTCHLHFWQNDRDLSRATAVTRGWNDTEIKVSTESLPWREKKIPELLWGLEPATFKSRARRFNHWAIPAPQFSSTRDVEMSRALHVLDYITTGVSGRFHVVSLFSGLKFFVCRIGCGEPM